MISSSTFSVKHFACVKTVSLSPRTILRPILAPDSCVLDNKKEACFVGFLINVFFVLYSLFLGKIFAILTSNLMKGFFPVNLLFFDADDTIIDGSGYIPPSTINAIHSLRKKGDLCFVNTGRPFSHIDQRVKQIGFDGFICSCGQHIEYRDKVLLHTGFSRIDSVRIAETVRACHLNALYEAETGVWLDFNDVIPSIVESDRRRFESSGLRTTGSIEDDDFQFDKFCVFKSSSCDFQPLKELIRDFCTMIDRGNGGFYECVLKGYSKASGIEFMREYLHVSLDNCYAFGDSTNDLPMLESVPHSVAMGGSPPSVRKACEFITDSLSMDGVFHALQRYGLIGPDGT